MKEIDWSKAPEGATHYLSPFFYREEQNGKVFYMAERAWVTSLYAAGQLEAKGAQRIDKKPAWTGIDLPPVGTVCEALHIGSKQGKVKVLYSGEFMVLWNIEGQHEQVGRCGDYEFHSIRTPEQIAAEEREKEIDALCFDIVSHYEAPKMSEHYLGLATALHKAGYRKTEAKQ